MILKGVVLFGFSVMDVLHTYTIYTQTYIRTFRTYKTLVCFPSYVCCAQPFLYIFLYKLGKDFSRVYKTSEPLGFPLSFHPYIIQYIALLCDFLWMGVQFRTYIILYCGQIMGRCERLCYQRNKTIL